MSEIAPIVIFVYNRPWHIQQSLEALKKNELAKESELFIYSDGPKDEDSFKGVEEVRNYIKEVNGFRKVTIIKRKENLGLANSIIEGVSEIVNKYEKIIVLEDDLVTSPFFLKFMNEALQFYENEKKIWHISGWSYPIKTYGIEDVFLWRVMNCWGWATWKNRWQYFEKNTEKIVSEFSKNQRKKFNFYGNKQGYWHQIIANKKNKINTWAIFWYATIFKNDGLCLNPSLSYVKNIGHDGSGVHCNVDSYIDNKLLNTGKAINFNIKIKENKDVVALIRNFYKRKQKSLLVQIIYKLSRIFQ